MRRLFKAVAGAIMMGVGSGAAAPAHAELLDFSFTTVSGATGSFTLDTDTPASGQPSVGLGIPGFPGIIYPGAVSNLSLSAPYLNLNNVSGDYEVIPGATLDVIGVPPGGIPGLPPNSTGILSGAISPSGCAVANTFNCLTTIGVLYSGNPSELSDDPASYLRVLNVDFFDPATSQQLGRDFVINSQVVSKKAVPEPDSGLSVLAVAIASASLLLKRKMNKRVQPS